MIISCEGITISDADIPWVVVGFVGVGAIALACVGGLLVTGGYAWIGTNTYCWKIPNGLLQPSGEIFDGFVCKNDYGPIGQFGWITDNHGNLIRFVIRGQ